jgi:hypothetical protein
MEKEKAIKAHLLKLSAAVDAGNLEASLYCIFLFEQIKSCPAAHRAAAQIIAAYQRESELSFQQQAELMLAHRLLAEPEPQQKGNQELPVRIRYLHEMLRLARSPEMWEHVYGKAYGGYKHGFDGETASVNGERLKLMLEFGIVDLIALEHEARVKETGRADLPFVCDLAPYQEALTLAHEYPPYRTCEYAEGRVERMRQMRAQQTPQGEEK